MTIRNSINQAIRALDAVEQRQAEAAGRVFHDTETGTRFAAWSRRLRRHAALSITFRLGELMPAVSWEELAQCAETDESFWQRSDAATADEFPTIRGVGEV